MKETVAILDAGAQYGKVIDRRVRELSVETHILPMSTPASQLSEYAAIIISGGPQSVYDAEAPEFDPRIFELGRPMLGICYGMQLINYALGGTVERKSRREDGPCTIEVSDASALFSGLDTRQTVLMSHGDSIGGLAAGFRATANSNGLVAAIEDPARRMYGLQFHPEVDLTEHGKQMLHNFLYSVAGLSGSYTMEDRIAKATDYIHEKVGDGEVLLLVSGGVDSTVCAALLNKTLGPERVHAIHIDNGFMRLDESRKVKEALQANGLELTVIDASDDFYKGTTEVGGNIVGPLDTVTDPQAKRHIIGDTFMRVAENAIRQLNLDPERTFLAQGSLRPDLIESASKIASGKAQVIKTHHNDTELVRMLREKGRVIEPLQDYHKDEARELGRRLSLPDDIVMRQPFPGPGLAVRILCAEEPYITDEFEDINAQLHAFSTLGVTATLLPVRTVGVQGDGRSYSYLAGLSGAKDWRHLMQIAREIPKAIHRINRVAYIFGEKVEGPVTEITPTHLTPDVIGQLQQADDIVNNALRQYGLLQRLSQVPVISFPVSFGKKGARSIAIRTFITNDFMTGRPAVLGKDFPEHALDDMVIGILRDVQGVSRVVYDLTSKPPGTTEWE
ncbi:MAG: glutamine-hydrolyzing GMP synthase [Nanoarchaeota archaeon]|nr:glutamine-hydrolyzing GMP synthase [Nanoarchaeota archaeon]